MIARTIILSLSALLTLLPTTEVAGGKPTPLALVSPATAPQATNPPYLSQMPSVERVKAEIEGSDPIDTAARQMGAFWQLQQMIKTLAGPRFQSNEFTRDEDRIKGQYFNAWQRFQYKENAPPPQAQPRWAKLRAFYENDPGFRDELLQRFFSSEFRAAYDRATGKQPLRQPRTAQPNAAGNRHQPTNTQPSATAASSVEAYVAQGDKFREAKDYPKAIEAYKRAIALNPSHGTAYSRLAVCYNLTKQWPLAISAWNRALALQPEANAFILLGDAHRELKQYDKAQYNEALKAYRSAIGLKPDSNTLAQAQFRIGKTYHALLQDQNAVTALHEALRLKPDFAEAYTVLGGSYLNLKQYPKALAAYQQAVGLKPDDPKGHFWIAVVYNYLKQPDKAVPAFRDSLRLKPDDSNVIYHLAETYSELKQYPNALVEYERMIRLDPDNHNALCHVGTTYARMGRKDDALKVYRTLLSIYKERTQGLCPEINKDISTQPVVKSNATPSQPAGGTQRPSRRPRPAPRDSSATQPSTSAGARAKNSLTQGEMSDATRRLLHELKSFVFDESAAKEALAAGADINWKDDENDGATILILAAQRFSPSEQIKFLLDNGADSTIKDKTGRTALDYARQNQSDIDDGVTGEVTENDRRWVKETVTMLEAARLRRQPTVKSGNAASQPASGTPRPPRPRRDVPVQAAAGSTSMPSQPTGRPTAPPSTSAGGGADAYKAQGDNYYKAKDYEKAIEAYKKALALNPSHAGAHFRLATTLTWDVNGQEQLAVSSYQEALRINPNDANAHRDLGSAYYHLKQYPQALESLQRAIRLKPDNANANLWLGTVYVRIGRKNDALQVYKTLLTLDKQRAQQLYADINKAK